MDDEYGLTEEEQRKVDEGEAAAFLLDNPAFLLAIERIRTQCAEQILTSDPDKLNVREDLYNLSRGLSAVTAELAQMQADGEALIENAVRPTQDTDVQPEWADEPVEY